MAATYQVGLARVYHSLSNLPALNAGDVVEIDPGTYNEVRRWTQSGSSVNPIVIRGVGSSRPVFDASGLTVDGALPNPRAVFQVEAHYLTFENIEFKNARNGNNGAGLRVTAANNITVRNCKITSCDMGMMCDRNNNLLIESSEIASNGTSLFDGYSHNLYLGGTNATLRFCYIHDALNGQNFKTRSHYTELFYCYIADSQDGEIGFVDAAETGAVNSHAVIIGNVVVSKPRSSGYNSVRFIQFGQDSGGQHNGTLYAFNNTFIAGDSRVQFLSANATGACVVAVNNIFCGSDRVVGTVGGGISGTNNWMQVGATAPATFSGTTSGSAPGFISGAARNLHLTSASTCRDRGLGVLTWLDGTGAAHSGLPNLEYVNHLQSRDRPQDGQIDIGAFEYRPPVISAIRLLGPDCLIDFIAVSGNTYDLEQTSDLSANSWAPVTTNVSGSDGTVQVTDANRAAIPIRFYRVRGYL